MKEIKTYLAPDVQELEICTEGFLCGSDAAGAGMLDDNSWDLEFN